MPGRAPCPQEPRKYNRKDYDTLQLPLSASTGLSGAVTLRYTIAVARVEEEGDPSSAAASSRGSSKGGKGLKGEAKKRGKAQEEEEEEEEEGEEEEGCESCRCSRVWSRTSLTLRHTSRAMALLALTSRF